MRKIICIFGLMFALVGCKFGEWHFVDFTDVENVHPGMFRVVSQKQTDLRQLVEDPAQLAAWGILPADTAKQVASKLPPAQRASSISINYFAQQLIDVSKMYSVAEGIYHIGYIIIRRNT